MKRILFALVLPACLAAQNGTPPVNPITAAFKGPITRSSANIVRAFDSIPESKFSYKPTAKQLTIGYIAQHVASDNYYFCTPLGATPANIPEDEKSTPDSVKATWPKDKLVAGLKASFAYCDQQMTEVTDANIGQELQVTRGTRSFSTTRASLLVGHVSDLADHYSQLANYMRLNGITPPSALPRPGRGGN